MSDAWAIFVVGALLTLVQALLCGILAWFAVELRALRKDLGYRVHVYDCERRMKSLEARVHDLSGK